MFLRLLHRIYRINTAATRWFRRRLTPAGYFVLAGLALTSATANTEQTLALVVFFFLLAVLLVAAAWAPFFRARLQLQRTPPRFVTAGEPFSFVVRLTNPTGKWFKGLEYLEDIRERVLTPLELRAKFRFERRNWRQPAAPPIHWLQGARTRIQAIDAIPPRSHAEVRIEVVAYRRGPLVLRGGYIARPDPLGLFRGLQRLEEPHTVLVLPQRYPLPDLDLPGASQYQRGGVAMAGGVGETEEFVALRDYRQGDSLRRVHWRTSARLGRFVVKEFQDEFLVRHALVLDTFCPPQRDDLFEEAVAIAASFACTVPDQESLLDLMFVGPSTVCITTGRGVGQPEQHLEVLATVTPCREQRFNELRALILQHREALAGAILVLVDWDESRRALVKELRALQLPTLVLLLQQNSVVDPIRELPAKERPDRWCVLKPGHVPEGLQSLAQDS